jgi:hypothetical protein
MTILEPRNHAAPAGWSLISKCRNGWNYDHFTGLDILFDNVQSPSIENVAATIFGLSGAEVTITSQFTVRPCTER